MSSSFASTLETLEYQTPAGKVDVPYAYIFDATGLTDGKSYNYLSVQIDSDSDFILRNISGASLCAGSFRPYYASRTQMFQNLINAVANWPVLPEVTYPSNSQIFFDLGNVSRAFNVANAEPEIFTSFLAFQGVRRYSASKFPMYQTTYNYRELPRSYIMNIAPGSAWTDATHGVKTGSMTYNIPLMDGDFQVCSIGLSLISPLNGTAFVNPLQLRLYDGTGWNRVSDAGFNAAYWNAVGPQVEAAPAVNAWYLPAYPAPSLVYPEAGGIKFEIQSLLPFADRAYVYQITFYGIQRQRNATSIL
jgi:hypothetical protein